ncbi:MAG: hypothetical protein GX635_10700 [Synergistaceae bacterium]|nr:hypothetical protein [Synergistaceae bacterium]
MNASLMPELLERIQKAFRPIEVRPGAPLPKLPGALPYVKELSGYPRFCGSTMGAEILWNMEILEKAASKPNDPDFTAEYTVAGRHTRVLGRNHRYLDYPVNVFLNICMLHDGQVEIFDFCLNLLAEIAPVNWYAQTLPEEMRGCAIGGKDAYAFDRKNETITLNVPTAVYKLLPLSLTSASGAVGRVMLPLSQGESFYADRG